jgi:hypothetical protein
MEVFTMEQSAALEIKTAIESVQENYPVPEFSKTESPKWRSPDRQ